MWQKSIKLLHLQITPNSKHFKLSHSPFCRLNKIHFNCHNCLFAIYCCGCFCGAALCKTKLENFSFVFSQARSKLASKHNFRSWCLVELLILGWRIRRSEKLFLAVTNWIMHAHCSDQLKFETQFIALCLNQFLPPSNSPWLGLRIKEAVKCENCGELFWWLIN